jgi:hypothetical protein
MYHSLHAASPRTLSMEAADSAETLVPVYNTIRGHDPAVPMKVTPDMKQTVHHLS